MKRRKQHQSTQLFEKNDGDDAKTYETSPFWLFVVAGLFLAGAVIVIDAVRNTAADLDILEDVIYHSEQELQNVLGKSAGIQELLTELDSLKAKWKEIQIGKNRNNRYLFPEYKKPEGLIDPEMPFFEIVSKNLLCKPKRIEGYSGVVDEDLCWRRCIGNCTYFAFFADTFWCNTYHSCDVNDLKQSSAKSALYKVIKSPPTYRPETARPTITGCQQPKVAITSMTRHIEITNLEFWLDYHFSIGVCHAFLRIQHTPDLRYLLFQPKYAGKISAIWLDDWKPINENSTERQKAKGKLSKRDWQTLFVDSVCKVADQMGFDWLFHYDDDELFWNYNSGPIQDHIKEATDHTQTYHYKNYESLYVELSETQKYPPFDILSPIPDPTQTPLHKYEQPIFYKGGKQAYGNGKSSGRVSPVLTSSGVHFMATRTNFDDSMRTEIKQTEGIVLHYESPDFVSWFQKFSRYRSVDLGHVNFGFYGQSADTIKKARDWYMERVGQIPAARLDQYIRIYTDMYDVSSSKDFYDKVPSSFFEREFPDGFSP